VQNIYIMKKTILCIYLLLIFSILAFSQTGIVGNDFKGFHYGISGKINVEFNFTHKPGLKFSVVGGMGYNMEEFLFFPTLHAGIIVFNSVPIGAKQSNEWYHLQSHFFGSLIGTVKLDKRTIGYSERYVPFYHFSDFTANPLQNPYKSSVSFGAIWAKIGENGKQRIGIFNLNIVDRVQITYYNDGGPVLKRAGDKHDRFYTGGILLSCHRNTENEINLIELSYHKFTGYQEQAFDIAGNLQIDYLTYSDTAQISFNQQRWRLQISNYNTGFGGSFALHNVDRIDLQDFLHFNTEVPYHPDYYKGWRWSIGGVYQTNYLKILE